MDSILSALRTARTKKPVSTREPNLTLLEIDARIVDMKLPSITVSRPSDLCFFAIYFGGIAVCLGHSIFVNIPFDSPTIGFATFFTQAGEWTVGYALFCYLLGWWTATERRY
jgi:hypothetical protein